MTRLDAGKFLEDLTGKHAGAYVRALDDMMIAAAMGNAPAFRLARLEFNEVLLETLGIGEILGASITLQEAAPIANEMNFAAPADRARLAAFAAEPLQTIIPRVTFDEAVQDMIDRTPVTIRAAAERTAQAISNLYSEGRVVAFVKSAEAAVTKRVQSLIAEMIREGVSEVDAGRRIVTSVAEVSKRTGPWTQAYARMTFRTNLNTAVTAGRFRQMRDPAIAKLMPAFEFISVGDVDTRDNHDAVDGLVMLRDDSRWNSLAPPLGYNCRCDIRGVGNPELRRLGRLDGQDNFLKQSTPAGARPDEGFRSGGRPDLFLKREVAR